MYVVSLLNQKFVQEAYDKVSSWWFITHLEVLEVEHSSYIMQAVLFTSQDVIVLRVA